MIAIGRGRSEGLRAFQRHGPELIASGAAEDAWCVHNILASPSDLHHFVWELKQDHVEEFKTAWRSSVGLESFKELLLGLLLNIFDARSRTYMIVVVLVQKTNIGSEAFLENYCISMKITCSRHPARQICKKVLQLSTALVEDPW